MKKIIVTGGTGNLGGLALKQLMRRTGTENISAIARDPSKLASFKTD